MLTDCASAGAAGVAGAELVQSRSRSLAAAYFEIVRWASARAVWCVSLPEEVKTQESFSLPVARCPAFLKVGFRVATGVFPNANHEPCPEGKPDRGVANSVRGWA